MKSTVKRWCKDFGYIWYSHGNHGDSKYEYKIIFENKRTAFFATAHGPAVMPKTGYIKGGEFLLFPVFSQVIGKKEISRSQFVAVCDWVKFCLAGNIIEFSAQQKARGDGVPHLIKDRNDLNRR